MVQIRYLSITFDNTIEPYEVPAFRGAVIDKVGHEHDLFHNHKDDKQYFYRYPLIQYKTIGRRPQIICINNGVDVIYNFFQKNKWDIFISNREIELKVGSLDLKKFNINIWQRNFVYTVSNWMALNQESYTEYMALKTPIEQSEFLKNKLVGNLLSFAKGIDWHVDQDIKVAGLTIQSSKYIKHKGIKQLCFNIHFITNIFLPNGIGIGKGVSVGFGTIREKVNKPEIESI